MKKMILGFIIGCMAAVSFSVLAASINATVNSYKVTVNGQETAIESYNINGNSYFKLRDLADATGGFSVGFENDTITITTNEQRLNAQGAMGGAGAPLSLDEMKTRLEQEVKDGKMTQEQADEMLNQFQSGAFPSGDRPPPEGIVPPGSSPAE
jgi:hypothetical protein